LTEEFPGIVAGVAFIIPRRKIKSCVLLTNNSGFLFRNYCFQQCSRKLTGLYIIRSRSSSLGFWQIFRGPVSWAEGLKPLLQEIPNKFTFGNLIIGKSV
jgi:hypothetical protein